MVPFAEQIFAYKADDPTKRIGGLVLEVKGDFCHKVRKLLADTGREADYVEVSLEGPYRYNPLHNDLDAYALAFGIASPPISTRKMNSNRHSRGLMSCLRLSGKKRAIAGDAGSL
jgi:hypothetical protein